MLRRHHYRSSLTTLFKMLPGPRSRGSAKRWLVLNTGLSKARAISFSMEICSTRLDKMPRGAVQAIVRYLDTKAEITERV